MGGRLCGEGDIEGAGNNDGDGLVLGMSGLFISFLCLI